MFTNLLQNLQTKYAATPMQQPADFSGYLPSTQNLFGTLEQIGQQSPSGFTPNYTGLFGMLGQQPQPMYGAISETPETSGQSWLDSIINSPVSTQNISNGGGGVGNLISNNDIMSALNRIPGVNYPSIQPTTMDQLKSIYRENNGVFPTYIDYDFLTGGGA